MGNLLNNYQLPVGKSNKINNHELPIEQVDEIADSLCAEYTNPSYRRWYCGVVYDFGVSKVEEWKKRAKEGKEPAKLFSKYVRDARRYSGHRVSSGGR